ncbi:hypothetical protein D3C84_1120780 [compost metagenome]
MNPDQSESFARRFVATLAPGDHAAYLNKWKGEAQFKTRGRRDLPLPVDRPANSSSMAAKPMREIKKPYTLLLPPSMLEAIAVRASEDGSSVSHHIRAAIAAYLKGGRK